MADELEKEELFNKWKWKNGYISGENITLNPYPISEEKKKDSRWIKDSSV